MPVKMIHSPSHGRTVKFGRREPPPKARRALPHFREFLTDVKLPDPPDVCDYSPRAMPSLRNILGNDVEGDCVPAGYWHVKGVWTGNATGTPYVPTMAQVNADYSAIGGYVEGDESTDNGCDEETAFAYWEQHTAPDGSRLLGRLAVDPSNPALLMQALWLFENLYFGVGLPDRWVNPMPPGSGFTWGVAGPPNPANGHCVMAPAYDKARGLVVDSWALFGWLTFDAVAAYCTRDAGGAVYVLISEAQLAKAAAKAPNGFAWGTLVGYFNMMGGSLPVPPTPVDPPVPDPRPPVTPPEPPPMPPPVPAPAPAAVTPASVFAAVNAARAARGLRPYSEVPALAATAQAGAEFSAACGILTHGFFPWRVRSLHAAAVGEDIEAGAATPQAVAAGWAADPGHAGQMFSTDYTGCGVGVAADRRGRVYAFADFARP